MAKKNLPFKKKAKSVFGLFAYCFVKPKNPLTSRDDHWAGKGLPVTRSCNYSNSTFFKPGRLKFFGNLTLYHSSVQQTEQSSTWQRHQSSKSSTARPPQEPRGGQPPPPHPHRRLPHQESCPRDPFRRVSWRESWIIEIRSWKAALEGWRKTGATCFSVNVAGGKREVAISSSSIVRRRAPVRRSGSGGVTRGRGELGFLGDRLPVTVRGQIPRSLAWTEAVGTSNELESFGQFCSRTHFRGAARG